MSWFDRMHPDGYILQRGPPVPAARIAAGCYFVVGLVLLPGVVVLLPGVLLEPMPLELGEVVLLLPLVAPPLLVPLDEPDLLKYASHSARDTCPSLFLSTAEKLGALPDIMPEEPDEPLELPVALGDDLSALPEAPVEDEPELCAMDTPAIAKSAAAVAVPTSFNIIWRFLLHKD